MIRHAVRRPAAAASLAALLLLLLPAPSSRAVLAADNWSSYLFGPRHTSYQASATVITVANAASLVPVWTWFPDPPTEPGQPGPQLFSSPTVVGGRIYIGSQTGDFYALDEVTGAVIWKTNLGWQPAISCPARGIYSTATVGKDPLTHVLTVYVAGQDGYLYALKADDGTQIWKAFVVDPGVERNEGLNWASPTIVRGHVFMGMSSNCDAPLIRGGLKEFDQSTGDLLATYYTVPEGAIGGSIWSSAAATNRYVFVTTGNAQVGGHDPGDSFSIVRLSGADLTKLDIWTVPGLEETDEDFGASPTLYTADLGGKPTAMVGACNKNGNFYALKQNDLAAGPVWSRKVGGTCFAAAVWDGAHLFVATDDPPRAVPASPGSISSLDPATGAVNWKYPMDAAVVGSPTLDGGGVLAVPTYDYNVPDGNAVYLFDAGTGALIATIDTGMDQVFAQPVFAGPYLFVAAEDNGLTAYTPSG
jgi:polyvinyl alcohol dehydrogenase (cytochrome)